jgi:glutathione peroxidase
MLKTANIVTLLVALAMTIPSLAAPADPDNEIDIPDYSDTTTDFRDIVFKTIDGDDASLADFAGDVILIVNVASKCGYTPQYGELEELYERYLEEGFVVIGFPANNFANQEPGTDSEIKEFCTENYGVTFPMMAKISVDGDDINPLYKYLTTESNFDGPIKWNFTKFLLSRDGEVVARFEPKVEPLSDEVVDAVKEQLGDENADER